MIKIISNRKAKCLENKISSLESDCVFWKDEIQRYKKILESLSNKIEDLKEEERILTGRLNRLKTTLDPYFNYGKPEIQTKHLVSVDPSIYKEPYHTDFSTMGGH